MVLLVLAAHAFVASATHFHAPAARADATAQTALTNRDEGESGAPSSGDPRCFLCRLQRDFVNGVQHSTPALAPPPAVAAEHTSLRNARVPAEPAFLRPGRAPPLA